MFRIFQRLVSRRRHDDAQQSSDDKDEINFRLNEIRQRLRLLEYEAQIQGHDYMVDRRRRTHESS